MVIGELKIECVEKIKSNPIYGRYEIRTNYTRTIVNEKCDGLVYPENGIAVTFKAGDDPQRKITFTLDRHYFTGELDKEADDSTTFSTSFYYERCVYEVEVDIKGNLVSFDEYLDRCDFEDGNEPDNHYTAKSRDIKWELLKH